MAMADNLGAPPAGEGNRLLTWAEKLLGTQQRSNIRPVYVVENQDWLAPKSNLSDSVAYDAIIALYTNVSSRDYNAAMASLKDAQLPEDDAHT